MCVYYVLKSCEQVIKYHNSLISKSPTSKHGTILVYMRRAFFSLVIFGILFTPLIFAYAAIVPCDGVTVKCQACHVAELGQNLLTWFIGIAASVIALIFAWGGMKMVMSAGNAGEVSSAKEMMTNAIIGFVILLSAYLIIDTIIKLVVKEGAIGTWNKIECVEQPKYTAAPAGSVSSVDSSKLTQCNPSNTSCSPEALKAAGFTQQQADIMSCIAMTESSGFAGTPPYNVTHPGSNSSACGTFQITKTTWNTVATGSCADFSKCTNAGCNAEVAKTLVSRSGYSPWTCAGCNAKAQACISKYGSN